MRDHADSNQNVLDTLSKHGLRLFPLPRNAKHPPPEKFYDAASNDVDFSLDLNNAGVATGGGIVVIDVDVKEGQPGLSSFDSLGPMPDTLTIRTPSGGLHYYFRTQPGMEIANSASKLGPGIDVRGYHGYVVAPGSSTPEGTYDILHDRPIAMLPEPIARRCKAPRDRTDTGVPATELDTQQAIEAATHWLKHVAPVATQGNAGDPTTWQVAVKVRDFGISELVCLELMAEHWNEKKAIPSWDPEGLAQKVANAYSYAQNPAGAKSPAAEFSEPLSQAQLDEIEASRLRHQRPQNEHQPDTTPLAGLAAHLHPLTPFDPATDLTPREFVLGHMLARRTISAFVSPPGIGKTTFVAGEVIVVASGKPILGDHFRPVGGPKHALLWCQEDDLNELKLRLIGYMRYHGITWDDFHDPLTGTCRLHILSGVERPLQITVTGSDNRTLVASRDAVDVLEYVREHNIAYAAFDPLVELHGGDENDNGQMVIVAKTFRTIAVKTNCHVKLIHHTKKHDMASSDDYAGDMWSGRGAGAVMGVARFGATFYTVGEKCAKKYGIPAESRHEYVRFDEAKNNLGPLAGRPLFFRRVSVPIPEIGSDVGILVPVEFEARERTEVRVDVFAADVRFVIDRMMDMGARSVGWVQVAEALQADQYGAGEDEPGRYGLDGLDALRKRVRRLFDETTGAPVSDELAGLVLAGKGRNTYIMREGVL